MSRSSGPAADFVPPTERPVQVRPFAQFFMVFPMPGEPGNELAEFDLGPTPGGYLDLGLVTGGWIDGERLKARILTGFDYGVRRADDTHVPTLNLVCETEDGDRFLLSYRGQITNFSEFGKAARGEPGDVNRIDWKVMGTFSTSASAIDWLNRTQFVARGSLVPGGIHYWAYELD
ncbi:MAG TPA: DUF3237 family protein [Pseudolysinimonas sp.]|nr:DUF3237 family protein [Pseudolysinimonas sp.]